MKKYNITKPFILTIILSLLVIGCGADTDNDGGASNKKDGDRTTITFWGDWTGEGEKQFNHMVELFNESQDDIEVEYVVQEELITQFMTGVTSGQVPDVILWDRWRTALYAPKNVLTPIDEFMETDGIDYNNFYEEALDELTNNEQLYGLPLTVDARALFYNIDHLEEANLEPPTNWEELREVANELTIIEDGDFKRAGMSFSDPGLFNMWLQQAGGQMLSDDLTKTAFNNDKGLEVLDFWNQLIHEDEVYRVGFDTGLEGAQHPFITEKVSMYYTGPYDIRTFQEYSDQLNFGIAVPPEGPHGDKGSVMGGFGLAIPSGSQQQEEAWEFIKWWIADSDNALEWGKESFNLPGNKEAIEDPFYQEDEFWAPFIETLEFATVRPTHPGYSVLEEDAVIPNLESFLLQKQSAEETLDKAEEQGERLLKENEAE